MSNSDSDESISDSEDDLRRSALSTPERVPPSSASSPTKRTDHIHQRILRCRVPGCPEYQAADGLKGCCLAHTILLLPVQHIARAPRSLAYYQQQLSMRRPQSSLFPADLARPLSSSRGRYTTDSLRVSSPSPSLPSPTRSRGEVAPRGRPERSGTAQRGRRKKSGGLPAFAGHPLTVAELKAEGLEPFSPEHEEEKRQCTDDSEVDGLPHFSAPIHHQRTAAGLTLERPPLSRAHLRLLSATAGQRGAVSAAPTASSSLSIPPSGSYASTSAETSLSGALPPSAFAASGALPPAVAAATSLLVPSSLPPKRLKPLTPVEEQRLYRASLLSSLLLRPIPSPLSPARLSSLSHLLLHRRPLPALRPLIHRQPADDDRRRALRRDIERRLTAFLPRRPTLADLFKKNVLGSEGVRRRSGRLDEWMRERRGRSLDLGERERKGLGGGGWGGGTERRKREGDAEEEEQREAQPSMSISIEVVEGRKDTDGGEETKAVEEEAPAPLPSAESRKGSRQPQQHHRRNSSLTVPGAGAVRPSLRAME